MVGYCFDTVAGSISRGSASSSSSTRTPPDNFFALPLPIGAGLAAGHPVTPEVRAPGRSAGMRRANRADVGQNGLELHPLLGRPFVKTDVRDARAERGKPRAS
jgi:hypothetical protein